MASLRNSKRMKTLKEVSWPGLKEFFFCPVPLVALCIPSKLTYSVATFWVLVVHVWAWFSLCYTCICYTLSTHSFLVLGAALWDLVLHKWSFFSDVRLVSKYYQFESALRFNCILLFLRGNPSFVAQYSGLIVTQLHKYNDNNCSHFVFQDGMPGIV